MVKNMRQKVQRIGGIKKAYKYEIFPNETQTQIINQTIGCCRFVWNWALGLRKEYKDNGLKLTDLELSKKLTELKKTEDKKWLNDVNAQALIAELNNQKTAFKRFFDNCKKKIKGKKGFPRFKSRGDKESFSNQQDQFFRQNRIIFDGCKDGWAKLSVLKIKDIPIRIHRPWSGQIQTVTISKTTSGRYFASVLCETGLDNIPLKKVSKNKTIGIDRGLKDFIVTSTGEKIPHPKYLVKYIGRLKVLQRRLSNKQESNKEFKTSNRYKILRIKLAKVHEKIANYRKDFLHKLTFELTNKENISTIGLENLNVSGMLKNRKLSKSISDSGWYEFERQLIYKGIWNGINIHKIDRFYPSSKTCSCCGYVLEELKLSSRDWICPKCKTEHDRDINAAINIKETTLRELQSNSGLSGST